MKEFDPIEDLRGLRKTLGLKQAEFWGQIGVHQTNGSRYEIKSSRMPKPVCVLLDLVYIRGLSLKTLQFKQIEDIRALRKKFGLSQAKFWSQVSVTQSDGCCHESDRNMHKISLCLSTSCLHLKINRGKIISINIKELRNNSQVQPNPLK